jgi:hypothetical protein
MHSTSLYVVAAPGIVGQILNDEAVLLLPARGEIKVLNAVGARIWSLADGSRTIAQIAAVIADEYAVQPARAETEALAFVQELARRAMLTLSAQPYTSDPQAH